MAQKVIFIKERTVLRQHLTKFIKKIQPLLQNELDENLTAEYQRIQHKVDRMLVLDRSILDCLLEEDVSEKNLNEEIESTDKYQSQWLVIINKIKNTREESLPVTCKSAHTGENHHHDYKACEHDGVKKRQFTLPKLSLVQFLGDVRSWIPFWGQFQKIDADPTIDDHDKFQYLLSAIPKGTEARNLIDSFPPSANNYSKAIYHLKQRYAREELLIEVYIRELLTLIISQVKGQYQLPLMSLYDKITTQLRALESMGLTSDKYAAMLYPMVESALPAEVLKAWERHHGGIKREEPGNQLDNILNFLKHEVESNQRISLAREGFLNTQNNDAVPTASCLVAGENNKEKMNNVKKVYVEKCIWCEKETHSSLQCFKALNLTLDERKEHLKKIRACFNCLKVGHNTYRCRTLVKCVACLRRHNVLLCPDIKKPIEHKESLDVSATLSLSERTSITVLPTLLVKVSHMDKELIVRALIDSGAQRSYIKKEIALSLGLPILRKEKLGHVVFGGTQTKMKTHNVYNVILKNLDRTFEFCMNVLDENRICGEVPRIHEPQLIAKLKKYNIILTDVGEDEPDVGILIGADYCGQLFTSNVVQLQSGLTAVHTKLGWTIQGLKYAVQSLVTTNTLHVADLWDLDVLGIKDPATTKRREEEENEVLADFKKSITINDEGRYEVSLPLKENFSELTTNRELAYKRLLSNTKRLIEMNKYEIYDKSFRDWLDLGIIEEVTNDDNTGHYLAHHAVIKDSSRTTKVRPVFDASAKDRFGNSLNSCLHTDVHITWSPSARIWLPCVVPEAHRLQLQRRLPLPLESDDKPTAKPYIWWRGNDELTDNRVSANGALEVFRKQNGSEGTYQCAVSHQGGFVLGYPVHLRFAHIEKRSSSNTRQDVHRLPQPVVLSCSISSGPPAAIAWTKDDHVLTESDRYVMLHNQLVIMDTTRAADGLYRCIATNSVLNKTRARDVALLETDEESTVPMHPSLVPVHHEEVVMVSPGSKLVLPCPVGGRPKPTVTWVVTRGDRASMLDTTSEFLVLHNIDPSKEGVYTCAVENTKLKKTFNVTVTEPVVIKIPPMYKEELRARTVRFNCTASGNPRPTITWYKDGKTLQLGGRYNLRKSPKDNHEDREELVVGGIMTDDAGIYQCIADNGVSVASSWAMLRVTGEVGDPPRNAACLPTGPRSVLFKWEPPERLDVVAYTVQTSFPDSNSAGNKYTSSPGQPHTNTEENVTVAKSLTPYGFQVLAIVKTPSKSIPSTWTESVICQGQGVPIQLSRISDHSVEITWKQFAEETPDVVQWILQYKQNRTTIQNVTLPGNVTSYAVTATTSEPLEVRVLGSKSLEWLPQNLTMVPWISSNDLDHGKEPVVPLSLKVSDVGPHEFTLTWRCAAPAKEHSYTVCVTNEAGFKKCVNSDREWVTIDNLEPDSDYYAEVQLVIPGNQMERQPFSQPVHVTTQPMTSDRFKNLSYKFINATTLLVSWTATSPRFTVYYTDKFYAPIEQWNRKDTKENSIVITGIDRTKKTVLQVTAYDPTEASKPIILAETEIKDVQYTYVDTGVKVSWNGTGPHVVRYSQNLTKSVEQWSSINATGNSVELNNLNPAMMTYVIVVTPGSTDNSHVLSIPPLSNVKHTSYYLGIGIPIGMCILCSLVLVAVCVWRRRKITRSPQRPRRRNLSPNDGDEEEASEMKSIGGRLANGGGSKDAGEPLLNGHVHITENPQSKAPNGKMRKGRLYLDAFDLTRYEEPDTTLETTLEATLEADASAAGGRGLLDTSRRAEYDLSRSSRDLSADNSFNKLPDDNMNSELTRSTHFEIDNSKIQPTLQPNG